jgi:tRNA threonylcarbamoyladenosine biosynthesis protein TsaB
MLVLGIDTSGKAGSIALARGSESGDFEVIEVVPLTGGTFSAQLVPQIAEMLARNNFSKHDVDFFAAVSGPGSFTGLRVGLAAIKALAEVLRKPIVAVSMLELIAAASAVVGNVVAVLDAGRNELYVGEYENLTENGVPRLVRERLLSGDEFALEITQTVSPPAIVVVEEKIASALRDSGLTVREMSSPRADAVARLGLRKYLAGAVVNPEELDANYIRRSDAEVAASTRKAG